MPEYTIVNMKEVEDQAPKFGLAPSLEARFAREPLGLESSGVSYQRLAPGFRIPWGHRHGEQEELYVLLHGSLRAKLDGEIVGLRVWDALRVPAGTMRSFEARPRRRRAARVRRADLRAARLGPRDGAGLVDGLSGRTPDPHPDALMGSGRPGRSHSTLQVIYPRSRATPFWHGATLILDQGDRGHQPEDCDADAGPERGLEAVGHRHGCGSRRRIPVTVVAIAESAAIPSAPPICWVVLISPDARPASCSRTPVSPPIEIAT